MPDTEVQTTDISTVDFQSFKEARAKGLTAIPAAEEKSSKEEPSDAPPKAAKPDSATETEQEESEPGKSKGKGGFQRRIDKLTARIHELEAKAQPRQPDLAESAAVEVSDKPKAEDFKGDDAWDQYLEALVDWKAEQKRAQWQAEEAERQQQQALKEQFDSYNKRVEETKEKYEDFYEVVAESDLEIPNGVKLAIIEMDNGPEVAYYLAQHPEVCDKMLEMAKTLPLKAIVEAVRISDKLMPAEVRSKDKPVSKAPPPINPVGTRSTKSSVPLGEMSFQDYVKAREAGKRA